jgi:hypothetical protein
MRRQTADKTAETFCAQGIPQEALDGLAGENAIRVLNPDLPAARQVLLRLM